MQEAKTNPNNKVIIGRKSLSIKRISKENNSDFSLSQLNDKFAQKILKNNDEGNDIKQYIPNISNDKKKINKTLQEEHKEKIKEKNISDNKINNNNIIIDNDNNILIDTHYISNIQNKELNKKVSNLSGTNINNHYKINYNINSTTNNNYYEKNKMIIV